MLEALRGPNRHRITPYSVAGIVAFKMVCCWSHIFLANVPGQVSPLAFGADPVSAGSVTKVPKAWGLTAPARSAYLFARSALTV
jgi:hypothetical protein